jgi:hypothetical protein
MPRFFFNVVNGDLEADKLGAELPDPKAARDEAVRTARELIAEGVSMHGEWHHWKVVVTDETGRTVMTVPFSEAARP